MNDLNKYFICSRWKQLFLAALLLTGISCPAQARPQTTGWRGPDTSPDHLLSLYAGTSPSGKRLGLADLKPLVLRAPMPGMIGTHSRNFRLKIGVFLMSVQPAGTVAKVEMLQSTGHAGLDGQMIDCLKHWQFRPNSVTEVRIPAVYGWMLNIHDRYYPTPKPSR